MSLIEWKPEYNLGVPDVDHEHRELVGLINALHDRLQRGRDAPVVLEFLGELYAMISAHFALEERVMRDAGYDEYQDHKNDHERLLDDIRDLMDDFEDGLHVDIDEFSGRLEHWFSEHFRTKDARLHRKIG